MTRIVRLSILILILLLPLPVSAQQPITPPVFKMSALELSFGGRVQTQLNTSSMDGEAPSQLLIRRARLEVDVKLNDWVSATINPDFAGDRISLKDAYVNLAFSPAVGLRVGSMHRPFGIFDLTSSKRMPVIERGLRIRGLDAADAYALTSGIEYGDRDIGAMIGGAPAAAPWGMTYSAGVFQGPLHGEVGPQDSYQFAARTTVSPVEGVRLGGAWSSRDFSAEVGEAPELRRGHAFEVDLEYGAFAPGLHLIAELSTGDLDPFTGSRFRGAHAWLAYRTMPLAPRISALEPVFRISHSDVDDRAVVPGGTLLTPGINLYFTPLTRAMLNYDVWLGDDAAPDAQSLKLMVQVAF